MSQEEMVRGILEEIEQNPSISQKKISQNLGISVGMVNWHIKRCVSKGFIKLQQAPIKRYLYYITPEGFAEKASLTADFLRSSFDIFKVGRKQYNALLGLCEANDWTNIVLLGSSELSELVILLKTKRPNLSILAVIDVLDKDAHPSDIQYLNVKDISTALRDVDVILGTSFDLRVPGFYDLESVLADLSLDHSKLLIPEFLK